MSQTDAEGWASLMLDGLKRTPDAELVADLDYTRREVAECLDADDRGLYLDTMRAKLARLEAELARRKRLAAFGGPAVRSLPGIRERVDRVKANIGILAVADLLGLDTLGYQTGPKLRYKCPVHGDGTDRHPSGVLNPGRNTWHCFGCNVGGDIFSLLMAFGKASTFLEALDWCEAHCGFARSTQGVSSSSYTTHKEGLPLGD